MRTKRNILQRSLAGFMAVWLSGVVFLFCCPQVKAAAEEADSCPLIKMGSHCDKAAGQNSSNNSIERTTTPCFECCAFLPLVFDKSRKIDTVQKQVLVSVEVVVASKFEFAKISARPVPSSRFITRIADRGESYLVHRSFRI